MLGSFICFCSKTNQICIHISILWQPSIIRIERGKANTIFKKGLSVKTKSLYKQFVLRIRIYYFEKL